MHFAVHLDFCQRICELPEKANPSTCYHFKPVTADDHQGLASVTGEKKLIFSGIYGFQDLYKMWQKRSWFFWGDKAVHYCWRFALISIFLSINTKERLTNQLQFNPIVLHGSFMAANLTPRPQHLYSIWWS